MACRWLGAQESTDPPARPQSSNGRPLRLPFSYRHRAAEELCREALSEAPVGCGSNPREQPTLRRPGTMPPSTRDAGGPEHRRARPRRRLRTQAPRPAHGLGRGAVVCVVCDACRDVNPTSRAAEPASGTGSDPFLAHGLGRGDSAWALPQSSRRATLDSRSRACNRMCSREWWAGDHQRPSGPPRTAFRQPAPRGE